MGLRDGTPFTQFDSVSSGRIYRTKNGLTPYELPNHIDPQRASEESTRRIFGGRKKNLYISDKLRYKLIVDKNRLSFYVFDNSLGNAKKRLLEKLIDKIKNGNIKKSNKIEYYIETYENKKIVKTNKYVFTDSKKI